MSLTRTIAAAGALALAGTVGLATTAFAAPALPTFEFSKDQYSAEEAAEGKIEITMETPEDFNGAFGEDRLIAVADGGQGTIDAATAWGATPQGTDDPDTITITFAEFAEDFTGTLTYEADFTFPAVEPPADDDAADGTDAEADTEGGGSADGGSGTEANGGEQSPNADADVEGPADTNASYTAQTVAATPQTASATTRIGDAPVAAERGLTIEPKKLPAADFVDEDKGVQITATGFTEGETVTLSVAAGPESVTGIEINETADAEGTAHFQIYGINAERASVYIGDYDITVTGADDTSDDAPLTGSFTVTGADSGQAGGSTPSTGGELPRTGAELGALGAGLGLLIAGGAMIAFTARRRTQA